MLADGANMSREQVLELAHLTPAGEAYGTIDNPYVDTGGLDGIVTTANGLTAGETGSIGLNDWLSLDYETTTNGVYLWIEILSIFKSARKYYGTDGMCEAGGLANGDTLTAYWSICFWKTPMRLLSMGEVCFFGWCKSGADFHMF